jgi:hypothetical protein
VNQSKKRVILFINRVKKNNNKTKGITRSKRKNESGREPTYASQKLLKLSIKIKKKKKKI